MPKSIQVKTATLAKSLEISGPIQKQWPNFGQLTSRSMKTYHCHLKKGKPTYVATWRVTGNQIIIDYIGSHENAPY